MTWQVARVQDIASHVEVATDVTGEAMLQAVQAVLAMGKAVSITQSHYTTEALKQRWEAAFYSPIVYKDGRVGKRRRYPRPQIEKDWMEWVASEKRLAKENRALQKAEVQSPSQRHPALSLMYEEHPALMLDYDVYMRRLHANTSVPTVEESS